MRLLGGRKNPKKCADQNEIPTLPVGSTPLNQ
jgi:hypothetical protein